MTIHKFVCNALNITASDYSSYETIAADNPLLTLEQFVLAIEENAPAYDEYCTSLVQGIPCELGFELGVQDSDQKQFTADVTGFQIKLLRGTAQLSDNVTITDKNGGHHTITIAEYLDALDIYHSALRSVWESEVGA